MSASIRLSRRKRSSIAAGMTTPTPVKPGFYGIQKPVQFAPNVTPGTYVAPEDEEFDLSALPQDEDSQALFPPSTDPAPAPSRRRVPMHKRRSLGYIPRPPNAFMLFRADFVRQRHVPGTIETNHGSLSKIIGNVWNDLPQEERKVWEHRAKIAKAEHKAKYPDYRFRPVHNKNKKKQKAAAAEAAATSSSRISPTDDSEEARVGEISALLMTGKKGADLAAAVAQLDHEKLLQRQQQHMQFFANNSGALAQPTPSYPQQQGYAPTQFRRRSSSVPVPFFNPGQTFYGFDSHNANESGIALPTLATSFYPGAVGAQQAASNISSPSDLSRPMSALALDAHQMQQMQFAAPAPVHGDPNAFLQPWSMPFNSRMSISNPQTILGLGLRRASSTSAIQNVANNNQQFQFASYARNWEFNYGGNQMDGGMGLQRDDSPLPEVNNSLFDPSFQLNGSATNTVVESPPQAYEPYASPLEQHPHGHSRSRSQTHMEPIAPHQVDTTMQYQQQAMSASASPASSVTLPELDQFSWMSPLDPNAVAGGEAVEVSIHAPAASMNGGFAPMESYGQQQQQQMWQWQGFGDAGMKGDGVHIDSFFPNNDGFNPSAVEIEAYM